MVKTKTRLVPIDKDLASTFAPDDLSVPKVFTDAHGQSWVKASEYRAWQAAQPTAAGITAND
jgi:hypothetical protein